MKKRINKRIWLGIRENFGRNLCLLILMVVMIAPVSGFFIVADSVKVKYDELVSAGKVEDGNITTAFPMRSITKKGLKKKDLTIEDEKYVDIKIAKKTLRVYQVREKINKAIIYKGRLPVKKNEIAINRLYAANNKINMGESIEIRGKYFLDNKKKRLKVVGFVSTPDYNSVFLNNADFMYDAINCGIVYGHKNLIKILNPENIKYQTSYRFKNRHLSDNEIKDKNQEIREYVAEKNIIMDSIDKANNSGIVFMMNDMRGDRPMILVFLIILISVIGLVFVAISSSTIQEDSEVIGTLLASGYRRREILFLYLCGPVIITIVAAVLGNILGYTQMTEPMVNLYYSSFELPPFKPLFNETAFVYTTLIPFAMIFIINFVSLLNKLGHNPLDFMRRSIARKKDKKALNLPIKNFTLRFAVRVILKSKGDFAIMIIGILVSSILLFYGLAVGPTFENYSKITSDSLPSKYQYILKAPTDPIGRETDNTYKKEEKFTVTKVAVRIPIRDSKEDVNLFGIEQDSGYLRNLKLPKKKDQIVISTQLAKKAGLEKGDNITLWDKIKDKKKIYKIVDLYDYPAALSLFLKKDNLNDYLSVNKDYYNGYFSDKKLNLDKKFIAKVVDKASIFDAGAQLAKFFEPITRTILIGAMIFFFIIIFMLTKLIIEKNSLYIAYLKIFGYRSKDICRIYMSSSSIIMILTVIFGLPLELWCLKKLALVAMAKFSGYFEFTIDTKGIVIAVIVPIIIFILVTMVQMYRISRMNFSEALKNRE